MKITSAQVFDYGARLGFRTDDGTAHKIDYSQQKWPRIEAAEPIEDGQKLAILVREFDGSISAVQIKVEQLAD